MVRSHDCINVVGYSVGGSGGLLETPTETAIAGDVCGAWLLRASCALDLAAMASFTLCGHCLMENPMTHAFQIDDMTCGHCAARITQAVKEVDSQADLKIDLATHTARISGTASGDVLAGAIRAAGYTPVAVPA